jgi:hypothetical protein
MHRLERAEPDALLAAPDLGVERHVRMCAHTVVSGARAAAGRHHGGGGVARKVRWSAGGATHGVRWSGGGATRGLKLPGGWVRTRLV